MCGIVPVHISDWSLLREEHGCVCVCVAGVEGSSASTCIYTHMLSCRKHVSVRNRTLLHLSFVIINSAYLKVVLNSHPLSAKKKRKRFLPGTNFWKF